MSDSQNAGGRPSGAQPGRAGRGQPGAMTMAMQAVPNRPSGPKVLRIGLIQGGKIVEERIIRKRETVTVGASEKNHFVLSAPGLSSRFELFQLVGSDYILNFTEDMRGRVGLPGGVQELEDLREGGARKADGYYQVKLTDSSRGKVVVGDTTLLFQFVVPPPVQPRPQLPAAVVGGFIAGIDWLFTAFVMFSFMTHFGFIIYLENADWPVEPSIATVPDRVADMIFNEPPPPEPEQEIPVDENAEEVEEAEEAEEVAEAPTDSSPRDSAPSDNSGPPTSSEQQSAADADARLAVEEAQAMVEQALLGALTGEQGAFNDVLRDGMVTGNAEDLMATAEGVGVATDASGGQLRERGGGGRVGAATEGLGGLRARQGATQAREEGEVVVERRIRGRVNAGALADESGAGMFDPSIVTRQIRARIRAIQTCYERELRNNPTLAGRVMVRFTIQQRGNVTGASATENTTGSPAVASCVVRTISRFRFNPGPEGGSVSFSYPFVFAPQN